MNHVKPEQPSTLINDDKAPSVSTLDPSGSSSNDKRRKVSPQQYEIHKKNFIKILHKITGYKNTFEVFNDFLSMTTISLRNILIKDEKREKEYFKLIKHYTKEQLLMMSELLKETTMGLGANFGDFLGEIFMELGFGEGRKGQFFTPYAVSKMMANVTLDKKVVKQHIERDGFITVHDCAVGAGCLIIASAEYLLELGYNPQQCMYACVMDVDSTVSKMCYIQLTVLGIPAEVTIGNSLTLEVFDTLYTPFLYYVPWFYKTLLKGKNKVQKNKKSKKTMEDKKVLLGGVILNPEGVKTLQRLTEFFKKKKAEKVEVKQASLVF
tara:strand:- start:2836 stop:3804 length:969 start_codon:yes stop_codon:yes gene_type:complete